MWEKNEFDEAKAQVEKELDGAVFCAIGAPKYDKLQKLDGSTTICFEHYMDDIAIIKGSITRGERVNVKWHEDGICDYLTLDEIKEQVGKGGLINIIINSMHDGYIFTYGNHGHDWEVTGFLAGYA